MATIIGNGVNLSTAQAGNGVSTNIADRGGANQKSGMVTITSAIGATPTCTYLIEASVDSVNWFPCPYADSATPETMSVATFVATTATTVFKILRTDHPWRFVRITYSANTNVTNTASVYFVS
jgi:hypothetical protein